VHQLQAHTPSLRFHFCSVVSAALMLIGSDWANQEIFTHSELVRNVNRIPARRHSPARDTITRQQRRTPIAARKLTV
jgi:hypothetical protein